MKKALAIILAVVSLNALADVKDPNWENGEANFNASNNKVNSSTIKWVVVSNINATCDAESKKRGFGGFGYSVDACSFWVENQCTIFTGPKTTMHQLGHETRHCFQGSFH